METRLLNKEQLDEVIHLLEQGEVVAFPTDTVYGVAVCYDNELAIRKMKQAKGRDEGKPFPMMVSSLEQIHSVADVLPCYESMIHHLMPGALTIVVKKKKIIPDFVTNGKDTIAIRMPKDDYILALIEKIKKPLLVTSANLSNHPSGTNTQEVLEQLDGRIAAIVMGESKGTTPSTIIDITTDQYRMLREGEITSLQMERYLK
ncbi:MAG: L-threonylcarbamoyladenylate synthase [Erysipelotrichaceae bacterium]|nr:L-threonylcarbamoyladenylate synthase [Erysipelotrichaceae bacterium]